MIGVSHALRLQRVAVMDWGGTLRADWTGGTPAPSDGVVDSTRGPALDRGRPPVVLSTQGSRRVGAGTPPGV